MSNDLRQKSEVEERLDDIYSEIVHEEYARDTRRIAAEISNNSNTLDTSEGWWEIENRKRSKFKYYYENYSFKKLIIDFFLIIITYGLIIFFFIYRHKKHLECRQRVRNGEFKEEDFMEDIGTFADKKDAKFLGKKI